MENAHKTVQDRSIIYHFQFSEHGTFFRFKMKFMYFLNDLVIPLKNHKQ